MKTGPFRGRVLESLLIVVAVGVAVAAVTAVANMTALAAARHRVLADAGWNVEADGLFVAVGPEDAGAGSPTQMAVFER